MSALPPHSVKAVLLDAFGTLLTLESPVAPLRVLLRERLGVEVTEDQAATALAAEVAYYRAHMHLGRDTSSLAELHRRCAGVLMAQLPGEPRLTAASSEVITSVLVDSLRFRAYPEAAETLARLRAGGLRLVVVSNWDASLEQVLTRVGLRPALDGVISSAVVGAAKPDPLPFERGLELAGASASEAVHVGDSEPEDVDGALAAGITPVFLRRGGDRNASDPRPSERGDRGCATISSLAELPALLGL